MFNLLVILGPTATGKTRLAASIAAELNGEIISADSRQVFKGMDIGTGKDLSEYGGVPYHLIDILEAGEEFSLFEFQKRFAAAFNDITGRKRLPLLVGGTGLYLDAVLRGYKLHDAPSNAELRGELEALSHEELRNYLIELDSDQHNSTNLLGRERIIRAIEIACCTNKEEAIELPELKPVVFGIKFPRELLRQRITTRLRERLKSGMIEEVKNLLDSGVSSECLDSYGLEYRYVTRYLSGELNKNDMFQKLNSAIHDFAKRQETWFRRMERNGVDIIWLDGNSDLHAGVMTEIAKREN
ncbi:MAG: tRNA (adenosine(37)-N6)-dimethylallyltransferase MiaA [Desulfuromonadales bacterium]|nr:tRNA (adenosine(37)-N6)-dimethylallyltransferase MiaA [Desulfuromonadales bacterium]